MAAALRCRARFQKSSQGGGGPALKAAWKTKLKGQALDFLTNLRGWRTSRKLLVFESDDWGSMRVSGPRSWQRLLSKGIRVDRTAYDSRDCLETGSDLEALFELLDAFRDRSGRPAVFTFNTVMGNPDFQAIREDDFEQYHFEGLFDSYLNFNGEDLRNKWKSAIDSRLISPQFHAREHLNVGLWMKDLRAGKEDVRIAFDEQYFALKATTSSRFQRNYLAAHWAGSLDHLDQVNSILVDGLEKFEQCFGLQSNTFVACNYIWPEALEQTLSDCGVTHLQTQRGRVQPDPEKEGAPRIRRHYTGQKSRFGQSFGVRNVLFEPFLDDSESWTDAALSGIERAFKLNRPAVVSSHRANYASGMDSRQRDRNLRQLNGLLSGVVDKFPDVEFISAPELAELMAADSPV